MTLSLAGRSQKTNKVRVLPTVGLDPEKNRGEMMRKEEEKLRAFVRRDNKQRRIKDRSRGMNAGKFRVQLQSSSELNSESRVVNYPFINEYVSLFLLDYLEDDEDGVSLNAIKNNAKKKQAASNIYSDSDSEDSDDSGIRRRKASSAKTKKIQESDEEEEDYFDKKARQEGGNTSAGTGGAASSEKGGSDADSGSDNGKKSGASDKSKSGSGSDSD